MTYLDFRNRKEELDSQLDNLDYQDIDELDGILDGNKELANQMLWYIRTLEKPADRPEGRNTHSVQKSIKWYMKKTSILIDEAFLDRVDYERLYKLKLDCKPDRKTKIETKEQIEYLSKTFNVDIDTFCFDYYFEVENLYFTVED